MKRQVTIENRDAINAELGRQIEAITKAKNPDEWARRLVDLFEVCDIATHCAGIDTQRINASGSFPDARAAMRTIARALPVTGADSLHLAADMFQSLCSEHEKAERSRSAWLFVDSLKPKPKPKPKPAPAPEKVEPEPIAKAAAEGSADGI